MKDSDDSGRRKLTLNEIVIFLVDKNINNKTSFNAFFVIILLHYEKFLSDSVDPM